MTAPLQPFQLHVPQDALVDLRDRLGRTRWPDGLPDVGWSYGIPPSVVKDLAEYWASEYDWRRHEAEINGYPHIVTSIDGTQVHALHVPSPEPEAIPLVLTHGWPGSIVEFFDVIGPLTDPKAHGGHAADAFHVVVPSIPGFGLSGPTPEPGWEVGRIARAWA